MAINLLDITANNNDLTNSGVAEYTADTPFAASTIACDFESTESDYLYITDANQTGLDFSTTFTLEGWIKPESALANNTWRWFVSKEDYSAASTRSYLFGMMNSGGTPRLEALVSDGSGNFDYYYRNWSPTNGTWYHVALTCNTGNASATTFEFFVDGVSLGNGTGLITSNISTIKNSTASFAFGCRFSNSTTRVDFFDGCMDDWRAWNDVRTVTEIADNRSVHLNGDESNLVGYWPYEVLGGAATSVKDMLGGIIPFNR